jgi:nitrate reductase delta subunit
LFEYPDGTWAGRLGRGREIITAEKQSAETLIDFLKFYREVSPLPLSELEELYTRTFDLNPVCALELGYHLFGENYKRGELLASLRVAEADCEMDAGSQLPDYLPVLLRLIVRLKQDDLRRSLIGECILPALGKMKEALFEGANPYAHLVEATRNALALEAPEAEARPEAEGWERAAELSRLYQISRGSALKF